MDNLPTFVSPLAVLVGGVCMTLAYFLRKFTPSAGWLHTPAATTLLVLLGCLLTTCAEAFVTKGLSLNVLIVAAGSALLNFVAATNPKSQSPPPLPPAAGLLLCLLPLASACACFTPSNAKYNTAECVVARGAVQCGISGVGRLIAPLVASATTGDVQALADAAKSDGTGALACVVSDAIGALAGGARARLANSDDPAKVSILQASVDEWKARHGNAALCFQTADGGKVCR